MSGATRPTTTGVAGDAAGTAVIAARARVPVLRDGDRLEVAEFERRYLAMPPETKAELIDGTVYMSSPVSNRFHGRANGRFDTWLGCYFAHTPGTDFGTNSTVRFTTLDQPQPDAHLRILPEAGGRSRHDARGYLDAMPELVAEIAVSSAARDLGPRLKMVESRGASEYVVWAVQDGRLDWYRREGDALVPHPADADGIHRSRAFPGLWLDAAALLRDDLAGVLAVLQRGIASPEHRAFADRLARAMASATRGPSDPAWS